MSSNKFTSRGFGSSGASQSKYNAPSDSYKPVRDTGSSFIFGGTGLRGSPKSGAQSLNRPAAPGSSPSSQASKLFDEDPSGKSSKAKGEQARGFDLSGGDITTSKLERTVLFVGLIVAALIISLFVRACAGGSDSSWVSERRSRINASEAE
jgi:hypothetical protein